MRHAVRIYVHEGWHGCPRRYAYGDHGGWMQRLLMLLASGLVVIGRGCEEGAMVVHLARR